MSFSISNWPPMFRSRLCDPTDPLYMGRSSDSLRTNTRAQRPGCAFARGEISTASR